MKDEGTMQANTKGCRRSDGRKGVAMIPTLLAVSGMAIFALALLVSVLTTERSATQQADTYRLSSTVESVAVLTTEKLWSGYLKKEGGTPGTIASFRNYLSSLGIQDSPDPGPPKAGDGKDVLGLVQLPVDDGDKTFQDVTIEKINVWRKDVEDSTQLYFTISATSNRGKGLVSPKLERCLQQVYTVEPADFNGFDYALLANNINCVFCHTQVDSVDRVYNTDPDKWDTFDRVKIGSLESLILRHHAGLSGTIKDYDADSLIAGTVYIRGIVADGNGTPISDWTNLAFLGYKFDPEGKLVQDSSGALKPTAFSPAPTPLKPFENLYLKYPKDYAKMPDGNLPTSFPAPIPDDGGIDPATGLPDPTGADNKVVDDFEFAAVAQHADGNISSSILTLVAEGEVLDAGEYVGIFSGGPGSVQGTVEGNLILVGTEENPITIMNTVAIDGDLIIQGYVQGQGTLVVRGNIYVPSDLEYKDGTSFGIDPEGQTNALGMAAGGNVLVGDYLTPETKQPSGGIALPPKYAIVDGSGDDNLWNFTLAEMSLFNRSEWAKTQPYVPDSAGEADDLTDGTPINPLTGFPETWGQNPKYVVDYVPRYYHFGQDDLVPIYNKGDLYWDPATAAWHGGAEVPFSWDPNMMTFADPTDTSDPYLFPSGGPDAVLVQATPNGGWLPDDVYKASIEYFEDIRPVGKPLTIDGLLYTNNGIFTLVNRHDLPYLGQMLVNGSLVAADLGMLSPGFLDPSGWSSNGSPLSDFAIGLQVNYDKRLKDMITIKNPLQVELKRTLWNPTANLQ